jgi:hypothetical protein
MLTLRDDHTAMLRTFYGTSEPPKKRPPLPRAPQRASHSKLVLFVDAGARSGQSAAASCSGLTRSGASLPARPQSASAAARLRSSTSMPALYGAAKPPMPPPAAVEVQTPMSPTSGSGSLARHLATFASGNQCRCQLERRLLLAPDGAQVQPTSELAALLRECGPHFLWCPMASDARLQKKIRTEYERQLGAALAPPRRPVDGRPGWNTGEGRAYEI